jgi:hypothetical protein
MGSLGSASFVYPDEAVAEDCIQSAFDRVIWYEPFWSPYRLIDLKRKT